MHLAGRPDGADVLAAQIGIGQCLTNTGAHTIPPIGRILLAPQGFGLADRLWTAGHSNHIPALINNKGFGAGRADVKSHQTGHGISFLMDHPDGR